MIPMHEITINLTNLEIKKLGELVGMKLKDDSDVEYAIRILLEQEPCVDCISRQSAIKAMLKIEHDDIEKYGCSIPEGFDSELAINALNDLPPVTPEQKKEVDA